MNEVLIQATIWMNLKNIMLSERSQSQRPHIVWFHLYEMPQIDKSKKIENKLGISKGGGGDVGDRITRYTGNRLTANG